MYSRGTGPSHFAGLGAAREDHHVDVGMAGADAGRHLGAVLVGQVKVEQHHVGHEHVDALHPLPPCAGRADDIDAVDELEQLAEALAHDRMVVDDQHTYAHLAPRVPGAASAAFS